MKPTIRTFTGREFWPCDPQPEMIDIRDIAHALSNLCRFCGHTSRFYSVAEHSLLVSTNVSKDVALWGLLHDASEAYLADLAKPLKPLFPNFVAAENRLMKAICAAFYLPSEEPDEVKKVDTRCLVTEARDFMHCDLSHLDAPFPFSLNDCTVLSSPEIEEAFLAQFHLLYGRGE